MKCPNSAVRLILIRHGTTIWNSQNRFIGVTDLSLDENGKKQANQLATRFINDVPDYIYSSPLKRAVETTEAIAGVCALQPIQDTRLIEMNYGIWEGLTLNEHFILAEEQKGFFIDRDKFRDITNERIQDFNIKGRPGSTVESLSGGNQQRALLALMRTPLKFLLIEHPTRGLDVESSIYIWNKLKERCRQGTSIVFVSADLDEILHYSDRVLVFFSGRVSQPLEASKTTVDQLGQLIGGKGFQTQEDF